MGAIAGGLTEATIANAISGAKEGVVYIGGRSWRGFGGFSSSAVRGGPFYGGGDVPTGPGGGRADVVDDGPTLTFKPITYKDFQKENFVAAQAQAQAAAEVRIRPVCCP